MDSKNIIITILVFIILILGYYTFSQKQGFTELSNNTRLEIKQESESYFTRNQECLKYKDEITEKLEAKDSPFGDTSLEQIFYSPKEDSCLYVEYSEISGDLSKGERAYFRRLFNILDDGPSSNPLEYCESFQIGDEKECEVFSQILEEYK